MTRARDWDAQTYDRVSDPQVAWSKELLDRLELTGAETVLDAGCGSGRVTQLLLDRLPRGRVIAVDAAPAMTSLAREVVGDRGEVITSSLIDLELAEPVDAIFSNAVFHWIPDHDALFARMFEALRPGGRMACQCGAEGNIDDFRRLAMDVANEQPYAPFFEAWAGPWNYAPPGLTARRLEQAGFADVQTWLQDRPVVLDDPADYLRAVCLGEHLERLPEELQRLYADRVTAACARSDGSVELGYVRLNITALRP